MFPSWENLFCNCFMSLLSSDSQRFDPTVPKDTTVWANDSGPALFKWRYNRLSTDKDLANIECYFEDRDEITNVIKRKEGQNPIVQTNDIQSTTLRDRVKAFVDPTDPSIFGFQIDKASKSHPKTYQCLSTVGTPDGSKPERSRRLHLQVLGNMGIIMVYGIIIWY